MNTIGLILILLIIGIMVAFIAVLGRYFGLWLRAVLSDAHVSFTNLIGMSLRKVSASTIVNSRIMAVKAGILINQAEIPDKYI